MLREAGLIIYISFLRETFIGLLQEEKKTILGCPTIVKDEDFLTLQPKVNPWYFQMSLKNNAVCKYFSLFFFACPKITQTVSCYPWEVLTKTTACRLHLKGTMSRDVVCKMWPSISVLDPRVIGNVIGATTQIVRKKRPSFQGSTWAIYEQVRLK